MLTQHSKKLLWSFIFLFALILGTTLFLLSYQQVYAGKIYKNVSFGDIDLSGKTKRQAEVILQKKFEDLLEKDISITANGSSIKAKLVDTGLSFDYKKIAADCYQIGRAGRFTDTLLSSVQTIYKKFPVNAAPYLDQAKYDSFVNIAIGQLNTEPKDASIVIKNGEIVLTDSQSGKVADTSDLVNRIVSLASAKDSEITLDSTEKPATVKNADFDQAKTAAQGYLTKQYVFTYSDKKFSPSKGEIGQWLNFTNTNGIYTVTFNDSNIKAYLNIIAKNIEIETVDRKINAATGAVIQEGQPGTYIDKDKTLKDLKAQLAAAGSLATILVTTYTDQPAEVKVFPEEGVVAGRFEGKYIDIDLKNQKLCRIEGPTIIDCFTISSGKPGKETPTGTFSILNKDPRRWSGTYGLWMPWWEEFKAGGWGLHELPEWPNGTKEGEAHLGIPVSHGCVRMGVGTAELVYNWTEVGTTVYIHK